MSLTDFQKPKCLHQNNESKIKLVLHTACEKNGKHPKNDK